MLGTRTVALAALSLLLIAATPSPSNPTPKAREGAEPARDGEEREGDVAEKPPAPAVEAEPRSTSAERAEEKPEDGGGGHPDRENTDWCSPPVLVQFGLFVVGILYTGFACLQWKAIRDQARIATRALEVEYRPWIVPTEEGASDVSDANAVLLNEEVQVRIELMNTGKTPALNVLVKFEVNASEWTHPMPSDPEYRNVETYEIGALGPGIRHLHPGAVSGMGTEVMRRIRDGSGRFTISGFVEYAGHATRGTPPYTTKFCLLWHAGSNRFVISGPYNDCT